MLPMKIHPKELEYWCTLDWDSLMIYLEKKFGEKYKNEIKKRLEETYLKQTVQENNEGDRKND